MQFFDTFYNQHYGKLWPSIRISLLSRQKYCALLNSYDFLEASKNESKLSNLGAFDFIEHAKKVASYRSRKRDYAKGITNQDQNERNKAQNESSHFTENNVTNLVDSNLNSSGGSDSEDVKDSLLSSLVRPVDDKNTSLYDFIPADTVYSERELKDMNVIKKSTFEDRDIPVSYVSEDFPLIPETLKAFCFERGNIDMFPDPSHKREKKLGDF